MGKNNFRPPPKVDSSVIRIEPRVPPPPLNFSEWDALTRIAFSRKNKTLMANFKTSSVIASLTHNYITMNPQLITNVKVETTTNDSDEMSRHIPKVLIKPTSTSGIEANKALNNSATFKMLETTVLNKVEKVLTLIKFSEKRARSLDVDDFIKLLVEFNKEGIHFV